MSKFHRANVRAAKVTATEVMKIRELYNEGWTQGRLSREFGLSIGQIGRIVRREAWQEYSRDMPPHPDELQHSLAKLDMILPLEGAELTPEEIENINKALVTNEEETAERVDLDEMFKRRSGGQPNDQGINPTTGSIREAVESPTAEGSTDGGSSNPVGTGPLPEASSNVDKTGEDA